MKGYLGALDRSISIDKGVIGDLDNLRADFHALPRPFTTGDAFHDALGNYFEHMIPGAHTDLFNHSEGIKYYGTNEGADVGEKIAVTRLTLLDGRSLRFRYNQYGEVSEIVYPGGGVSQVDYFGGVTSVCQISAPIAATFNRKVSQRRTLTDGTNVDATWVYGHGGLNLVDGIYYSTTSIDVHKGGATGTLLSSEKHSFLKLGLGSEYRPCFGLYTGTGNEKWQNAKEFRTETQTGTGTIVTKLNWEQRAPLAWANDEGLSYNAYVNEQSHAQDQPPNDDRVTWEETTLENGKVKRVEYGYDDFNNITSIKEYDFGTSGSPGLLRETVRTYAGNGQTPAVNGYCYTNLNPLDASCGNGLAGDVSTIIYQRHLLLNETIKDGSGNPKAYSEFEYDQYGGDVNHAAVVTNPGMIMYDGARFASFNLLHEPRGNVTKVTRWLSGGTDVVAYSKYDNAGQVVWSKDPKGNVSTVSYADNFGNGTNPELWAGVPGAAGPTFAMATVSTNALGHQAKVQYDYSLGAATGVKDPNGVIAKTEYDNLGRPFRTIAALNLAEQSISEMTYPTETVNEARVSKQFYANRWLTSKTLFDGFDRPVLAGTAEDGLHYNSASYTIFSKTVYDPLGRAKLVTNPYRAAAAVTDGWSRSNEDLAGRLTEVASFAGGVASPPPDSGPNADWGGSVTSVYASEVTTVTDQAGKKRRSVTDGLGRLVRVDEPDQNNNLDVNGVPFQSTSYTYDALDNLITVTQGTQTPRSFVYDSLKRLTAATNPESGTINYTYDDNGNLLTKTDARGVVATYAYDALNRNTSVVYTNDPANTPAVTRTYDGATNGKGRLWKTETAGANGSRTTNNSFDALGRPTSQSQQFYASGAWSQSYTVNATYDVSGHVLSLTYPSGHTASYTYDDAGRTSSFAGNLGDAAQRTYSTEIMYSASGAMTKEEFATDTPVFNKLAYNSRGQLAEIRASTSYTGPADLNWNRGKFINWYSPQCGGADCNDSDNNGNLRRQDVFIPHNDQVTSSTSWYQKFDYDGLNRLNWVQEYNSSAIQLWQQEYEYDRYGNRKIHQTNTWGPVSGPLIPKPNFEVQTSTNRLYAPGDVALAETERLMRYDDAGNLKKDRDIYGATVTRAYDAENRMTSETRADNSVAGSYTYNADGQRVRRKVNGVETWQVYGFGGELVAEYSAGVYPFLPQKEYGYRNGQLLVTVANGDEDRLTRFINNVYWGALGRLGTPAELSAAQNSLGGAADEGQLTMFAAQLGLELFQSLEYEERQRTNEEFVSDLYHAYLQRAPDPSGYEFWVGELEKGQRSEVHAAFPESGEFYGLTARVYGASPPNNDDRIASFVRRLYLGALAREETSSELSQAAMQLNTAGTEGREAVVEAARALARSVYESGEYAARERKDDEYVMDLIDGLLGRGTSAEETDYWEHLIDLYSRERAFNELSAGGEFVVLAGTLYREVNWLVTDQLGTPRMVFDKTGTLAGAKRHDYLPFGEELVAGQGGRTTTMGYSGDNVRQKFTSKERDNETGLDYFLARYYSSTQGRFTSPDEFKGGPDEVSALGSGDPEKQALVYADVTNPQSLNKYQYTFNNPLRYVDPDGHSPQERLEIQVRQDEKKFGAGKMSKEEFLAAARGRGVAVAVALAIYAASRTPQAAMLLLRWAARNPDKAQAITAGLLETAGGPPGVTGGVTGSVRGIRMMPQFTESTIEAGVRYVMSNPNNISHIFANVRHPHRLETLVKALGGQASTVRAVLGALNGQLPSSGLFERTVSIAGRSVFVSGSVVDGVPKIGTMYVVR